ncbi:hypothetical protein D3C87_1724630 [compost metagenome]
MELGFIGYGDERQEIGRGVDVGDAERLARRAVVEDFAAFEIGVRGQFEFDGRFDGLRGDGGEQGCGEKSDEEGLRHGTSGVTTPCCYRCAAELGQRVSTWSG